MFYIAAFSNNLSLSKTGLVTEGHALHRSKYTDVYLDQSSIAGYRRACITQIYLHRRVLRSVKYCWLQKGMHYTDLPTQTCT